jgi:hypothetical protein
MKVSLCLLRSKKFGSCISTTVQSFKHRYTSTKIIEFNQRKDIKHLDGKVYNYSQSAYADRIFNELHALWISLESLCIEYQQGDDSACDRIKAYIKDIDIR